MVSQLCSCVATEQGTVFSSRCAQDSLPLFQQLLKQRSGMLLSQYVFGKYIFVFHSVCTYDVVLDTRLKFLAVKQMLKCVCGLIFWIHRTSFVHKHCTKIIPDAIHTPCPQSEEECGVFLAKKGANLIFFSIKLGILGPSFFLCLCLLFYGILV